MIYVVGLGPGESSYITQKGAQLIEQADIVIGGKRNLQALTHFKGMKRELDRDLSDLLIYIQHNQSKELVILASGDPLIYGIGKYLSQHFDKEHLCIISGISAIQYMFSQIPIDMNDVYITSSHGKVPDFDRLLSFGKVAMVTDRIIGPPTIAGEILKRGLKKTLYIGENLSYNNQKITQYTSEALCNLQKSSQFDMNVVVIVDEK